MPDVYVDFYVNPDLPELPHSMPSTMPLRWRIRIRQERDNYLSLYPGRVFGFDATCPQHIGNSTSVDLDDNGAAGTATCSHCNAIYRFMNLGYPDKGYPLKRYSVTVSGRILRITN